MANVDRLEAIAQDLESKAGITPSTSQKRDTSVEGKLRRIAQAITALQLADKDALTDAPSDGTLYARKDGAWDAIPDGATVEWGEINGTLAQQTDLQAALDLKSDTTHTHLEADIIDLDKYSQAVVDSLLSGKSDTNHTHTEADITNLDKYTQAQVDSALAAKANSTALTAHTGTSIAHGTTGAIVGTSDSQTLSNKSFSDTVLCDDRVVASNGNANGEVVLDINQRAVKIDMQNRSGAWVRGIGAWNNTTRLGGVWIYGTDGTNVQRVVLGTEYNDDSGVTYDKVNGRVGINDNTPSYELDVNGTVNGQSDVTIAGDSVARSIDVQEFTSSDTWTKPTGAKRVAIHMWGGGGGGGSGAKGSSNTGGGAGGCGGEYRYLEFDAADLGATETVTVGAAGGGGAAVTGTSFGNAGTAGGDSSFNGETARGGNAGAGGRNGTASGGALQISTNVRVAEFYGIPGGGGAGGNSSGTTGAGTRHGRGGGGGGGGGGHNGFTTGYSGGQGGALLTGTSTTGGSTGAGAAQRSEQLGGSGGKGGNAGTSGNGAAGAAGGAPAGGGGGGGATITGTQSGAGASGGAGKVVVITYF